MAERVDLRLQIRDVAQASVALPRYRFARLNGWHCGHWHKTIQLAAKCVK